MNHTVLVCGSTEARMNKNNWRWLDRQPRWVQILVIVPIWAIALVVALVIVFPRAILALLLLLLGYLLWQNQEYQAWFLSPVSNGLILAVIILLALAWRRE